MENTFNDICAENYVYSKYVMPSEDEPKNDPKNDSKNDSKNDIVKVKKATDHGSQPEHLQTQLSDTHLSGGTGSETVEDSGGGSGDDTGT